MSNSTTADRRKSQYTRIATLLRDKQTEIKSFDYFSFDTIVDGDLGPIEVPQEIKTLINQHIRKNASLTGTSAEIVASKVNELELERKALQVKELADFLVELPKYSIDGKTQSESLVSGGGLSLQTLMNKVYSLPEITFTPTDSSTNNSDSLTAVTEYNTLKESLTKKCYAIQVGEENLKKINDDIKEIATLEEAVKDHLQSDDPEAIKEYMKDFSLLLETELKATQELLNQALKSSNTTLAKKKVLKNILEDF